MVYRFGDCRLDDAAGQLRLAGQEQRLTRKAYQLLLLLLKARPRVVTKQQVMDALWPDTFVAEANIAVLIGEVRAAVGDSPRASAVIRTHSGVGYSFVAPVVETIRDDDGPPAAACSVLVIGNRRVLLPEGVSTVGRDESCDVHLPHPSVSRVHARIDVAGGAVHIEDAGSKNGVRVNGRQIRGRTALPSGVGVVVGSVEFRIVVGSEGGSTLSLASAAWPSDGSVQTAPTVSAAPRRR
jgi:DNA-binding winged helix-turn-helix (wHTH) protein